MPVRPLPAHLAAALCLALLGCDDDSADPADASPPPDAAVDVGAAPDAMPDADLDATADAMPDAMSDAMADVMLDVGPDAMLDAMLEPDLGPPATPYEAMDRCFAALLDDTPATGVTVAIVEDGVTTHLRGYGHRGDPDATPVEPSTLFRFGSVLKGMTALGLLRYVDRGEITLDTRVVDVVPALGEHPDPRWHDLTIHHLLSHQGGFADHIALQGPNGDDSELRDYLTSPAFAMGAYFMADPGTFYNYANPNFMVAGLVLETLAEVPYREAMQREVFAPLGLERMPFLADDVFADGDYATGVATAGLAGTRPAPPDAYDSVWTRPAGLGWASVIELARYGQYIIDGETGDAPVGVVEPETWALWRSAQVEAESINQPVSYGYGLSVYEGIRLGLDDYRPVELIGHDGNIAGYSTSVLTAPSLGLVTAVLANGDGLNGPMTNCVLPVLVDHPELPAAESLPAELAVDPTTFGDYPGAYLDPVNVGATNLELRDGALYWDAPAVDAAMVPYEPELIPLARDVFLLQVQGLAVPLTGIRREGEDAVEWLRTRFFVQRREEMVDKRAIVDAVGAALRGARARANLLPPPTPPFSGR